MKRSVSLSLLMGFLALSSTLFAGARAHAQPVHVSGVQATITPSPISLQRLKTLVSQTLGQKAVDIMRQRITQPLSIHSSPKQSLLLNQTGTATASPFRANVLEHYGNSPILAGYITNAEGVSWAQGAFGLFNVVSPAQPAVEVETAIAVTNSDGSAEINLGVEQTEGDAYLSFHGVFLWVLFHVNVGDQMDAEIYLDGSTNEWLLFIEDLTTGVAFGEEFSYTTTITRAAWAVQVESGGPVPAMVPITFTNAQWLSNWAGWQPIISSAAATSTQWTLQAPYGGQIWPTEIPDPPGTSFSLIPCPAC